MVEIREKMLAADVIVWASPIYFYTMTAQMEAGDIRKTDAPNRRIEWARACKSI